jgi:hypothetical protein
MIEFYTARNTPYIHTPDTGYFHSSASPFTFDTQRACRWHYYLLRTILPVYQPCLSMPKLRKPWFCVIQKHWTLLRMTRRVSSSKDFPDSVQPHYDVTVAVTVQLMQ